MRGRRESWRLRLSLVRTCDCIRRHCAVVRSVAAAAGGQRRIVVVPMAKAKGSQPEEQDKKDGENAPHLAFMLHELWSCVAIRERDECVQVSSMHLDFPTLQLKELMPSQVKTSLSERDSIAVESSGRPPLRIALFGFGTVGSSVARILLESKPEGLELTHIFNRNVARKKVDWVPESVVWSEDWERCWPSDVDVIVELAGGLDPAGTWVRRAIEIGQERRHGQQEADRLSRRGVGAAGGGQGRSSESMAPRWRVAFR